MPRKLRQSLKNKSGLAEYGSTLEFFRNIISFHFCYATLFAVSMLSLQISPYIVSRGWFSVEYVFLRTKPPS